MTDNTQKILRHFETLFGTAAEGYIVAAILENKTFTHHPFPYSDRYLAAEFMANYSGPGHVFAAFALHDERAYINRTRKAETARVIPGVQLDLDLASGVHAAKNLPATPEEALALVREAGVPDPTMVIHSGGGLYATWLLDKPFVISSDADRARISDVMNGWHGRVNQVFTAKKLKLDKVTDLPRLFRVPGCSNPKTTPPKPVELLELHEDRRWSLEQLEQLVIGFRPGDAISSPSAALDDLHNKLKRDAGSDDESKSRAARGILAMLAGCGFFKACVDDRAQLDEPRWKDLADLLAHVPGGDEYFHRISQADPRYSHQETEEKLQRAKAFRPKRCETIAQISAACASCLFREARVISTPVRLTNADLEMVDLLSRYVLDTQTGIYFEPKTGFEKTKDDFNRSYRRRVVVSPLPSTRFESTRFSVVVDRHDYLVGEPRRILTEGGRTILNIWSDGGIEAVRGDASVWIRHLEYLIPNDEERHWFIQYLAHLLQRPAIKINSAFVIQSKQGVGKNLLAAVLGMMMHPNDLRVLPGAILGSRWKAEMGNTRLLILDETQLGELREAENEFKQWASEETTTVERKGIDSYRVRTPRGIGIFSNSDRPISLQEGERRHFVVKVSAERRDPAYYDELVKTGLSESGVAAFKDYLMSYDLTGFNPKAAPPMTEAKHDIIEQSRSVLELQIETLRDGGLWPFDKPVYFVRWVALALKQYSRQSITPQKLAPILAKMGDVKLGMRPVVKTSAFPFMPTVSERSYAWAWQDHDYWEAASEAEVQALMERRPFPVEDSDVVRPVDFARGRLTS
jgi:hypothetical protein